MNKLSLYSFDLSLFSRYRLELMGFATILILICHAPYVITDMSGGVIRKIVSWGNLGVEIFFFLSGIGMFYSLSKSRVNIISWYKKRYVRILLPYIMIAIPWFLIVTLIGRNSLMDFLFDISTLSYWIYHRGAWFIAALIPLYLITPLLFKGLTGKYKIFIFLFLMILTITLGLIDADDTLGNIFFVIKRLPCYFCGMFMAKYILNKESTPYLYGFISILLLTIFIKFIDGWWWPVIFLALAFMCNFLKKIPSLTTVLNFMGTISLESYIMNICLNDLYRRHVLVFTGGSNIYLDYLCIVIIGIVLAFVINRLSSFFIKRIIHL